MSEINRYIDIGKMILTHRIFSEKHEIENPTFPGNSLIEQTLWYICREKDDDKLSKQERSSTASITRKLNNLYKTWGS